MREIRRRSIRLNNDPAYPFAGNGYESPLRETQNKQQLIMNPVAPDMETYLVNTQKSAEGIVLPVTRKEGPNAEMSEAIP
jgi:hypothetical protein